MEFDVAISFAGEQRAEARAIADTLTRAGVKVFFDEYEAADLWGKDLYEHLAEVYRRRAQYCIILVSEAYAAKAWPTVERRSAQARALEQKHEYILPVRFDNTDVPGLLPTVGYLRYVEHDATGICAAFLRKLRASTLPTTRTLSDFVSLLETRFNFRWEPASYISSSTNPVVYWPVRLRLPTPIHAVQAFAAAGLKRYGADIVLYLDDLGTPEYSVDLAYAKDSFASAVDRWFQRVTEDFSSVSVRTFTQSPSDVQAVTAWSAVEAWLGKTQYRLDKILPISKLMPVATLDEFTQQRPRRLLTPAMVWSGLSLLQRDARPVITLGGYDERFLWQAYRDCAAVASLPVGHLYAPELLQRDVSQNTRTVHMSRTNLAWESREDITRALLQEIESGVSDPTDAHRLIAWSLEGCILLPALLRGDAEPLVLAGRPIQNRTALLGCPLSDLAPLLAEVIGRWLL
jgi:hypothetical protein